MIIGCELYVNILIDFRRRKKQMYNKLHISYNNIIFYKYINLFYSYICLIYVGKQYFPQIIVLDICIVLCILYLLTCKYVKLPLIAISTICMYSIITLFYQRSNIFVYVTVINLII